MALTIFSSSTVAAAVGKRRSKNVAVLVVLLLVACASSLPTASSSLLRGGGRPPRATKSNQKNLPSAEDDPDHERRQVKKEKKYDTKKYALEKKGKKKKLSPSESTSSSTVDTLFDAYATAVNLGIIDPTVVAASAAASSNGKQQQPTNILDPIAQLMTDTVTAVISQLDLQQKSNTGVGRGKGEHGHNNEKHRRRIQIRIENEIMGNTFSETNINGLNFSPIITVDNDMHDSMHDNNNAHSDSGSVLRQNGVADFHGALQNNNNAYSVDGDVIRQNGLVNTEGNSSSTTTVTDEDGERNDGTVVIENDTSPPTATNPEGTNGNAGVPNGDNGRNNNNNDNDDDDVDDGEDIIIIHNRIINNTFTSNKQNGLIVTPTITVRNDMSDAFYDNNNAKSKTGNVQRQNAVADFSNALTGNNNAYSETGDVVRQNGIITEGGGGLDLTADALQEILDSVFGFIADLESLLPTELIEELFGAVVNELEQLIGLGSSSIPLIGRDDADVFDALTNIQSDINSDDAILVLDKLLQFLDEGIVIDIGDCSTNKEEIVSELFDPLVEYLTTLLNRDDNKTTKEDIAVAVVIGRKDDNNGNDSNNNKTNIRNNDNNNNVRRRVEKYQLRRRNSATIKNNENEYSPYSKDGTNSSKRRSLLRKLHSGDNNDGRSKVQECTGQNMMTSILDATLFGETQNSNSVAANILNSLPPPAKEILTLQKNMVDAIDEFVTTDLKLDGFFS